jgi:uncharacterized membrane protein
MLGPVAVGGFVISFALDLVGMVSANATLLHQVAYYTMIAAILAALAAALPGLADLVAQPPDSHFNKSGLADTEINVALIALYVANAWMRHDAPYDLHFPILLSLLAMILLLASGWLGEKMAPPHGVGAT